MVWTGQAWPQTYNQMSQIGGPALVQGGFSMAAILAHSWN